MVEIENKFQSEIEGTTPEEDMYLSREQSFQMWMETARKVKRNNIPDDIGYTDNTIDDYCFYLKKSIPNFLHKSGEQYARYMNVFEMTDKDDIQELIDKLGRDENFLSFSKEKNGSPIGALKTYLRFITNDNCQYSPRVLPWLS